MPDKPASTLRMEPDIRLSIRKDSSFRPCAGFQKYLILGTRKNRDGDSGHEVKSLQDVNSLHDMMKWGHRYKYAPQFWCALSVQLESLAQKREEVIETAPLKLKAARLKLETARLKLETCEKRREAAEVAMARHLYGARQYFEEYWVANREYWVAYREYDASFEDLGRLMSEEKSLRAHRAELNRIILNYLKLRHPQFHDGVRSSRQYYEEKDCNGGTKPIVQVKITQENWPLTADGDHGHHAMDDKRKGKPLLDMILGLESKKLQSQLMARDPEPNIKYYSVDTMLQRYRMLHMQEREIVHRDLKPSNTSNTLVVNPVDCPSKTGFVYAKVEPGEDYAHWLCQVKTTLSTRHTVLDSYATPKTDVYSYATPKTDIYSFGMTCYETLTGRTGKSPFGTKELPYARMSSGRTRPDLPVFPRIWSTEEIGALLKTSLLAPKQDGGPDWDYVSEHLLEEYGIDRAAKSCEILWGSLLRRYNAIRDHELKIYNLTKNGPNYFEMDEEERLRNMLPPMFDLEWCKTMETILKAKPGEVQSGTTADECTGLSNDEDVLCGEDEAEDESCESAVSEVEDSTSDSYVPQTEPTCTDKETIDASATLRNVVEDMVRPLITALRTRVEEEQKHRQEVLTAEMDKVTLMLQDIRRVLVHSNETRGKDLPESPSQQMVPAVASGGKRKADMDVDREAKKQAV